jgi:hypothetical protein
VDGLYDSNVEHRHKHNMILIVEDGLLTYHDENGKNLPYSRLGGADLKHRFTFQSSSNKYVHLKLFSAYLFMVTASKTLLYPEFTDYMGSIVGRYKRDQA